MSAMSRTCPTMGFLVPRNGCIHTTHILCFPFSQILHAAGERFELKCGWGNSIGLTHSDLIWSLGNGHLQPTHKFSSQPCRLHTQRSLLQALNCICFLIGKDFSLKRSCTPALPALQIPKFCHFTLLPPPLPCTSSF